MARGREALFWREEHLLPLGVHEAIVDGLLFGVELNFGAQKAALFFLEESLSAVEVLGQGWH